MEPDLRAWEARVVAQVEQAATNSNLRELDAAIALLRRGIDAGSGDQSRSFSYLGAALSYRYQLTGHVDSLRAAIAAYREALTGAPDRPGWLSNLGEALTRWFELTDDVDAITEAVGLLRASTAATAANNPYYAGRQSNLGVALTRWFERTGDAGLLSESILACKRAASHGSEDPAAEAALRGNLGNALMLAVRHVGAAGRLPEAIAAYRQAVALIPPRHPHAAGCLAGLGNALVELFNTSGDIACLVEAISVLRLAAAAAAAPDLPSCLAELATGLRVLFAARGDALALEEAIDLLQRAAELTHSHPDRVRYRSNLALAMRNRYEYSHDLPALRAAVQTIRSILAEISPDHPEHAKYQADLANSLHRLGENTRDRAILAESAELLRAAVAAVPPIHPDRAMHLGNLGGVLSTLATVSDDVTVLTEAVDALHAAERIAAGRAVERAGYLLNLGHAHAAQYAGGDSEAYQRAARAWRDVEEMPAFPALFRATAAQNLGILCVQAGDIDAAATAFATALELLDLVAWRGLERRDQERLLLQFSGLAAGAAACMVRTGKVERAVELLEQGRGVLLSQVMDSREDYDELRRAQPDLAGRLEEIHRALEVPAPRSPARADPDQLTDADEPRRLQLATERDQLLGEIRRRPQFERFLLAPQASALRVAARHGPIVAVYVSAHGCGALIISADQVQRVELPQLTLSVAAEQAAAFLNAVQAPDWQTNDIILGVLAWMWDTIAGPVLDRMEVGQAALTPCQLPRLWWLPTGPLTVLPLHAAGHYDTDHPAPSALDRAVSSYTPTIRALLAAQAKPRRNTPATPLVVAVSHPGGHSALSSAAREADLVMARLPATATLLADREATRDAVMARLGASDWAHFACHAATDPIHPSDSRLVLHDGPLRVRELTALRISAGTLAFLSACGTAYGGSRLPDETIHISSAFMLAGYSSVIGTLWNIDDSISRDVAEFAYASLASQAPARAVHRAVSEIRLRYPRNPFLWAAHIHLGA